MAYVHINGQIKNMAPASEQTANIDGRYGPYAGKAAALAAITGDNRKIGLTVGVLNGSSIQEMWFYGGIADNNLVDKIDILTSAPTEASAPEAKGISFNGVKYKLAAGGGSGTLTDVKIDTSSTVTGSVAQINTDASVSYDQRSGESGKTLKVNVAAGLEVLTTGNAGLNVKAGQAIQVDSGSGVTVKLDGESLSKSANGLKVTDGKFIPMPNTPSDTSKTYALVAKYVSGSWVYEWQDISNMVTA